MTGLIIAASVALLGFLAMVRYQITERHKAR